MNRLNLMPWRRRESLAPAAVDFDFDDFWNRFIGEEEGSQLSHLPEVFRARAFPAINVAETEEDFCITVDCPGLDEKDIQVEMMGHQLVISGERKWEQEKKGKEFRRVESQYGKFERVVRLPENARFEPKQIEANYKKGVLHVTVPKMEKTPASKIPVHGE